MGHLSDCHRSDDGGDELGSIAARGRTGGTVVRDFDLAGDLGSARHLGGGVRLYGTVLSASVCRVIRGIVPAVLGMAGAEIVWLGGRSQYVD